MPRGIIDKPYIDIAAGRELGKEPKIPNGNFLSIIDTS